MTEDMADWTRAVLVGGGALTNAAQALADNSAARSCLKVFSGEHLAAIFLSGLFGQTPSQFDDSGGPDLIFADPPDKSWFPFANPAAFEIKSLEGEFRKALKLMLRRSGSDQQASDPFNLRIWTAAEVMLDAHETILRAQRSLVVKTSSQCSRNVFLITHPYDHFALDVARSQAVSALMPQRVEYRALDTLWVYWPPDKLVMWSRMRQAWTDIIFVVDDARTSQPYDMLSFIQNVELTYILRAGLSESPYVFNINFV